MTDERQMSATEWRVYFDELRERAKDPSTTLSLEDFRALAHYELIDRVRELESGLGNVERSLHPPSGLTRHTTSDAMRACLVAPHWSG